MNILVTGGAGFIGSHTLIELYAAGHTAVVVDNFCNSCPISLRRTAKIIGIPEIPFYQVDIRDREGLGKVMEQYHFDACIHFAGLKAVGESVSKPWEYYDNNISGTLVLLDGDNNAGPRFINPSITRGVAGFDEDADWHLAQGSPCIDAGIRIAECVTDGDIDQSIRIRNGIMDLGCYESNYPVGIAEVATAKLAVYPNPAADVLTVLGCGNAQVDLYDIAGRRIYSHQSQDDTLTLDLSHYVQGIYFVKVGANTAKVVKK